MSAIDNARAVLADPYSVSHRETLKALSRLVTEHERVLANPLATTIDLHRSITFDPDQLEPATDLDGDPIHTDRTP